ncbi:exopolysaccharide biosynthesis polyprenyl glycosylphosphotransferase [Limnohabitans sp. Rim8]|uniref:exopolysaccharide biosynthesis polyprenyl glycosylphosphotransferase n=1 Tax=Limnohabitans sp. Rim8 TaxID=1100718 RepID=UPI0025CF0533|nr:exopolysaccharide biosynthesis polyprenyl glycosylphosphotransferase [Limnohabitans sp. Rim8]
MSAPAHTTFTSPVPHVVLVITKGEAGGAQTHVLELCRALQDRVRFTVLIGGDDTRSVLGQALNPLGITVLVLPTLQNSLNPLKVLASVRALLAHLRVLQPDVIHAHSAVAGVISRLAGKLRQIPVVYTVHGFGFKPQAPWLIRTNAWLAEAVLAAWTTRMVCVSAYEKELAARLPMPPDRVSVVHNALADVPWRSDMTTQPPRLVMVARMAAPKRHDVLIEALALLAQRGLQPETHLLGGGPELARHQAAAAPMPHVRLVGDVNDVAERLAQHQIFVLLSDHEGLPISILEAMRSGMAIVATRLPGIEEMLTHEQSAWLVPNTPQAVAQALQTLLADAPLRQRLGQAARERYEAQFQPEAVAESVRAIYQQAPLMHTARWPMTRPRRQTQQLASQQANRQSAHLVWSLLGLAMIGLAYAISQVLMARGLATVDFGRTVLASLVPYALAAHLLYRGAHMPAAERGPLLLVTTGLPFWLTPLAFALLQQPYSRGALLLTYVLCTFWFWLADQWCLRHRPWRLVYQDPRVPGLLAPWLPVPPGQGMPRIRLLPWPAQGMPPGAALACDGAVVLPDAVTFDASSASATSAPSSAERQRFLTALKLQHIRLYSPESLQQSLTGRMAAETLQNELWQTDGNPAYDLAKRLIDVGVVLALLPMWLPLALLVACGVKIDSPGPALFSQRRTGMHGQSFRIWKFRSMRHEAQDTPQFAQANDPRITRFGHWIRRTRLDEIPQLFNVLMGHMSLIGPRPEQDGFVQQFAEQIPSYPYRHLVRPGLTGWAQVQQGYAASADETAIKLSYDLYYITHYSLAMDLLIVFKTIQTVLTGRGAR